jgi:hypothetical protein
MGQSGNPASSALRSRKEAIEARLEDLYQKTWDLLDEHRDKVLALAAVLEDRKTISGDDVAGIMGIPAGFSLAREPRGWQLVDEAAAEERRRSALASLPPASNGHASEGQGASEVTAGDIDGADRTVDDQLS